jgi:hypothetical protein
MSSEAPFGRPTPLSVAFALTGLMFAAIPFFAVDYVPATDLPQHVAQIRLLRELWGLAPATLDAAQFTVRPFGANTLCYWPLLALSALMPAVAAARLGMFLWIAGGVLSLHAMAWRRNRPPAHALLAGMLLFGVPLYWGLLNFVCGIAPFLWLCERALRERKLARRPADYAIDASLLLVLYLAHVLWVACAAVLVGVVAIRGIIQHRNVREAALWLVCFVPLAVVVAGWLAELSHARALGADLSARYSIPIASRFSLQWIGATLFGGLKGPFEPIAILCLAVYAAAAYALSRRAQQSGSDRALLAIGLGFTVFALLAPDNYLNTIAFNDRFLGCGAMFLVLSLPAAPQRSLTVISVVIALSFSLVTTAAWVIFEQDELSGLRESLATIDRPRRLLELDYRKHSDLIRERPFMQLLAYAQAAHGGEPAFSFAEHGSSIVAYRDPRRAPWTPGLEWFPELARPRDIELFDCILVNGTPRQHTEFAARFGLQSAIREGYFRSYCHSTDQRPQ